MEVEDGSASGFGETNRIREGRVQNTMPGDKDKGFLDPDVSHQDDTSGKERVCFKSVS